MSDDAVIAIVGCGIIGQSWALTFARAGRTVALYDHVEGAAQEALPAIEQTLHALVPYDLLDGQEPETILERIDVAASLQAGLANACHVQESTPEIMAVKSAIFRELDVLAPPSAVIASSTSALLTSHFAAGLAGAHRCLVAHPLNPPHLIPAVEIVPAPVTSPQSVEATVTLMRQIGQQPIVAGRELEGFVMNRLQGALLDEAFALLAEGVASIEDIDCAMRDGLARRWSFMGPFETIDLNAPGGVAGFIARYGEAYARIGRSRPNRNSWHGPLAKSVVEARRAVLDEADLPARQAWRDRRLAALASHILQQKTTGN